MSGKLGQTSIYLGFPPTSPFMEIESFIMYHLL